MHNWVFLLLGSMVISGGLQAQKPAGALNSHKAGTSFTIDDLIGVWERDTKAVGDGLAQHFRFYADGTFALHFSNSGEDLRTILALSGRYRLVEDKLYLTILYRTVVEGGRIGTSGSNDDYYNFRIAGGVVKDIREPDPKELPDPLYITQTENGHLEIGNEDYYKVSREDLENLEPGPPDSTALPALDQDSIETLVSRIQLETRLIDADTAALRVVRQTWEEGTRDTAEIAKFYSGDRMPKVVRTYLEGFRVTVSECYFKEGKLIFVREVSRTHPAQRSSRTSQEDIVNEFSYYFAGGRLIQMLLNGQSEERKLLPRIEEQLLRQLNDIYQDPSEAERMPAGIPAEQKWWNLLHYDIQITPDYQRKFISGTNTIRFGVLTSDSIMQVDLQQPLVITAVDWQGKALSYYRRGNAYFIRWPRALPVHTITSVSIRWEGIPRAAVHPPWDSGWIWATDQKGRPWMSVACEGSGASVWLPCKDVGYDEPDNGISFEITVPDSLTAVANGRPNYTTQYKNGTKTYRWEVRNPINNYDMIPYIGKYVTWHEDHWGLWGPLDCDFWVLDYDLEKARSHFRQVDTMLRCFEYWMGPYPFYDDGYKLVEAPMPGMEHQSAIAYGNGFGNGYSGKNLSGTSWGLKWDFILVHESGHEWFGNSITANSGSAGWIHEGFTKYLETLYTDFVFGREAGNEYALGINKRILNDAPVLGGESSDKYNKSSAMLHMIRQIVGDSVFREMLLGLNKRFYHQTVGTEEVRDYMARVCRGVDLTKLFEQYMASTQVPTLEYSLEGKAFRYRWINCVKGFNMPVKLSFDGGNEVLLYPTTAWKEETRRNEVKTVAVDKNFYVGVKRR